MVLLDVVYNHFGPDGNYLHAYAPQFFTDAHQTPWGAAINFDGRAAAPVRDFFIHNALYWLEEFHFDGLRLDAVHAIVDDVAAALRRGARQRGARATSRGRHVHLVLENDRQRGALPGARRMGRPRATTAQWNDDLHHALHVLATGETDGYYADYAGDPVTMLGRALAEGFVYQGEASPYRGGAARGERSAAPAAARHSSRSRRTTTRSATAHSASGLRCWPTPSACARCWRCVLLAPQIAAALHGRGVCRIARRFCSSATSAPSSQRR